MLLPVGIPGFKCFGTLSPTYLAGIEATGVKFKTMLSMYPLIKSSRLPSCKSRIQAENPSQLYADWDFPMKLTVCADQNTNCMRACTAWKLRSLDR